MRSMVFAIVRTMGKTVSGLGAVCFRLKQLFGIVCAIVQALYQNFQKLVSEYRLISSEA